VKGLRSPSIVFFALLLIAALLALSGCAAPDHTDRPDFVSSQAPAPGLARMYIFRPAFTDQPFYSHAPVLRANGQPLAAFPTGKYISVQLQPGLHAFTLEPGAGGSALWRASFRVKAEAGQTLYLGFWMGRGFERAPAAVEALGRAFFIFSIVPPVQNEPNQLRLEPMEKGDAEPMLRECDRMTPAMGEIAAPSP